MKLASQSWQPWSGHVYPAFFYTKSDLSDRSENEEERQVSVGHGRLKLKENTPKSSSLVSPLVAWSFFHCFPYSFYIADKSISNKSSSFRICSETQNTKWILWQGYCIGYKVKNVCCSVVLFVCEKSRIWRTELDFAILPITVAKKMDRSTRICHALWKWRGKLGKAFAAIFILSCQMIEF